VDDSVKGVKHLVHTDGVARFVMFFPLVHPRQQSARDREPSRSPRQWPNHPWAPVNTAPPSPSTVHRPVP